jgi:hypothetical protein
MDSAAYHKTVMALDVAGYHGPEEFWNLLRTSFAEAGVPWDVLGQESGSDGAMIQLPAQVAKADLVASMPDLMLAEQRRYTAVHAEGAHVQ